MAYFTGGLVLDVPAKSIPALVDWTLREAELGQPDLAGPGKDADSPIVLTEAALERYGLPITLTEEEKHAGRIPEGHKVIKQLARAEWKLTMRGFGPWARIYRPARCVSRPIERGGRLRSADGPHRVAGSVPGARLRLIGGRRES